MLDEHDADQRHREPGHRLGGEGLAQHRDGKHRGHRRHEVEQPADRRSAAPSQQHEQQQRGRT
jgi:hypothetical protein